MTECEYCYGKGYKESTYWRDEMNPSGQIPCYNCMGTGKDGISPEAIFKSPRHWQWWMEHAGD